MAANQKPILNNRYQLEKKLGKGAMGNVFLAMDLQEQEPVAIKTINQDMHQNPEVRERFKREVVALRKLSHPNIVSYVDNFTASGRACLVMEFVGGGTLADIIKDRQQLDHGFFKSIATKVISAMAAAHQAGIIHRDLKPTNIFMTAILEPKVGDFGLAKINEFSSLTMTGTTMGTLAYMAPEAFEAMGRPDHRADIWALGVIFYEMLTGNLPFPTESQPRLIGAILREPYDAVNNYRTDIPVAWQLMIETCLEKNPDHRYQNVMDMMDDLNEIPRSRQQFREQNPLGGSFEFRFLEEDLDIVLEDETQVVSKTVTLEADPSIEHAAATSFQREGKKSIPTSLLILAGILVWSGIGAAVVGGGGVLYGFIEPDSDFAASIDSARAIALIGSVVFAGGLGLEAMVIRPERALELVILIFGITLTWFAFFSGYLLSGYAASMIGMAFYVAAVAMYFQTQRT